VRSFIADEADWLSRIDKTRVEEERPVAVGSIEWMTDHERNAVRASDQRDISSLPESKPEVLRSITGLAHYWWLAHLIDRKSPDQPVSEIRAASRRIY
jgi:hypothetical protein